MKYEGAETDDCPRCYRHFHTLVATYPSFQEDIQEEIDEENSKDPKYVR
jgi:ribosome-binding protein aMBF1 (putative translation factor)